MQPSRKLLAAFIFAIWDELYSLVQKPVGKDVNVACLYNKLAFIDSFLDYLTA
jgi:hypothetical protein